MPRNPELPDLTTPVEIKWGQKPKTDFKSHLSSINVKLMNAPSMSELKSYIPEFSTATWEDKPRDEYTEEERLSILRDLFDFKLLPTALESIGMVFRVEYMDLIDVTHLIRHRTMSFSAHCTADRDMRHDDCMVKPGISEDPGFYYRYKRIVNEAKQLYADMVDSKKVSLLDARSILPRSLESHYYMRGNLKDLIGFVKQRLDRQIQPMSDNIIALRLWIEIVKQYPMIKTLVDVDAKDQWYINTAPTGRNSNIYIPEEKNDVFEWKDQWFIYNKTRDQFPGADVFTRIHSDLIKELDSL